MSYCDYCEQPNAKEVHKEYHRLWYGFPLDDDNELFGRLVLEINQAGLSWETILNKADNFREAYSNFDVQLVANYTEEDRERLLSNAGIIRNRLKINAAIHNAQQIVELQRVHGSFQAWLDLNHPKTREEWTKLFKKTFKFVGGEIVNEFLMSTGYLRGAHEENCTIFATVLKAHPKWNTL